MSALPVSGCWGLGFRVLGFGLEGLWYKFIEGTHAWFKVHCCCVEASVHGAIITEFYLVFRTATVSLNSAWILLYSSEKG